MPMSKAGAAGLLRLIADLEEREAEVQQLSRLIDQATALGAETMRRVVLDLCKRFPLPVAADEADAAVIEVARAALTALSEQVRTLEVHVKPPPLPPRLDEPAWGNA